MPRFVKKSKNVAYKGGTGDFGVFGDFRDFEHFPSILGGTSLR